MIDSWESGPEIIWVAPKEATRVRIAKMPGGELTAFVDLDVLGDIKRAVMVIYDPKDSK